MKLKTRFVEYSLVTGFVYLYYALTLPIYFHYVFGWGMNEMILWWITGAPVEFVLAYPLGKMLWRLKDPIQRACMKVEGT